MACLHDLGLGFIAKKRAAFGVAEFAALEKDDAIRILGIDVQRAALVCLAKHLDHAWEIKVREAAAEVRFGARKHLRRPKAFVPADEKTAHVRRDIGRRTATIDIIVAARSVSLEQR